jgi:hypothetical protein
MELDGNWAYAAYPNIPRGDIYSLYMFDGLVSLYFFHLYIFIYYIQCFLNHHPIPN